MSLVMTAAAAAEPVALAEAKTHLRVDSDAENALITSLIVTSRLQIEAALGIALMTQGWRWTLDAWPEGGTLVLPMWPVQSVAAIEVRAADGTPTTVAPSHYLVDGNGRPPRIVTTGAALPMPGLAAQGIAVNFTAGFGALASDVPAPIRHALLLLVAHWFENREPADVGGVATRIPDTVSALLSAYREVRL